MKNGVLFTRMYLKKQFIDMWKHKLFDDERTENGNKLRSYRPYKDVFRKEEYLQLNPVSIRGSFSRLRLSAHNLHIETGRYLSAKDRKNPEDRICYYCNMNICEDEYHLVMKCHNYNQLRCDLFSFISTKYCMFENLSDNEKFIWLKPLSHYTGVYLQYTT